MKTPNNVLMVQAREALSGKWGLAVGAFALNFLISLIARVIPFVNIIVPILISGALVLGVAIFSLALSRGQETRISVIFRGFDNFGRALATYLLMILFIALWTLLLIIPGIIATFSYAMTFYILADNPEIGPMEAIDRSKRMMMGNRWKLFCLGLRFLGWAILSILTLGIGFFWLTPYISVATAKFYDDIKNEDEEEVEVIEIIETVTAE